LEEPQEQAPLVLPGTSQSWLLGVLQGGSSSWASQYIESEFFELARQQIQTRTGGFDVQTVILACAALNAARTQMPAILDTALNQVKSQVTSSVVISGYESQLYKELLSFAREKSQESQSSGLQFLGGQHKMRSLSGDLTPFSGNTHGSFWHNGTHYTIEMDSSETVEKSKSGRLNSDDFISGMPDPSRNLTVRCFSRSQAPILALFEHIQKRISQSQKLEVIEMQAGARDKHSTRNKRPLATVDLPPAMMKDITIDVELFFHKDSQAWYEQSGRPYRMGILAHGPPGTGKSSLVAGIASHINVPLVLINLQGMSDNDLREAFSRVPFRSVVALEDIDCVGADVGNRGAAQDVKPKSGSSIDSSDSATPPDNAQAIAIESMMAQVMDKQAAPNQKVMSELKAIKAEVFGDDDYDEPRHRSQKPSTDKNDSLSTSSVTLSGLLNVIDGVNASEGRLVIMTTNHPEKLDPALYRAGRIERKFEITYASKASSIMTFKRLFDFDVCKRYTSDAIDRFAFAFQAQFPSKSRITAVELAKYCGQYRGIPDIAVEEFADWLKIGADKFTCPVDYTKVVDEAGVCNVPEPFDPALLQVSPSDLVNPNAGIASGIEVVAPLASLNPRFPDSGTPSTFF
jgi:chaperone BCS1